MVKPIFNFSKLTKFIVVLQISNHLFTSNNFSNFQQSYRRSGDFLDFIIEGFPSFEYRTFLIAVGNPGIPGIPGISVSSTIAIWPISPMCNY
jgi:hypothetical protein